MTVEARVSDPPLWLGPATASAMTLMAFFLLIWTPLYVERKGLNRAQSADRGVTEACANHAEAVLENP